MINVKPGQLTFWGQFDAYKSGQSERNIQFKSQLLKIIIRTKTEALYSQAYRC